MIETVNGSTFKQMVLFGAACIAAQKQEINDLNVFPVPDGDTGTNMSLTISTAVDELKKHDPATVDEAAKITASGLLRGARGNSGVILSLLFRGMSKVLKGLQTADGKQLAAAMSEGVTTAYGAVMKPAEGTVLTVSRRAAETAATMVKGGVSDIEEILSGALDTAKEALSQTVEQNPVLKKAGVVDAGGQGYVWILTAMLQSLRGEFVAKAPAAETKDKADFDKIEDKDIVFTYCTEFIVARERERSPELLRTFLNGIGDSLVLVEDDDIIKVHVHTDAPGRALTEALRYGALQTVKIENMRNQHTHMAEGAGETKAPEAPAEPDEPAVAAPEKEVGFVAVCAGQGMKDLFLSLGADRVVTGGQTMNPSTEDILNEVNRTPAQTVFVFPNNKNIIMAAEQCAPLTEKTVRVVPTTTVPQGVSALAYMEPDQSPDELFESFKETAENVHTAHITYAARDSEFDGQTIHAGEHLALLDGKLLGSYPDVDAVFADLTRALAELDPEFLTVYYGADVTAEDAEDAKACLSKAFPEADISVVGGGQPVYYYMIAAE